MIKKIKATKKRQKGHWVPRGIGKRVITRARRFLSPNQQKVTINGVTYIAAARQIKSVKRWLDQGMTHDQIKQKLQGN